MYDITGAGHAKPDREFAIQNRRSFRWRTRSSMAQYIRDYLLNDTKLRDLIPANVAITNVSISDQIKNYNELMLRRDNSPATHRATAPSSRISTASWPRCGGRSSPRSNRISRRSKSS